ncbi:6,7-dimethyl-8-ribityllumazine synthase [Candidatus Woesearchaeota archaeon]|nr:6,7-dimethyl-8-ribityllumazine synthase [Candidatus Woesearchaeota archaeon]
MAKAGIAIVVSEFNPGITGKMRENAEKYAKKTGMDVKKVITVPGAFEIPLAVKRLLKNEDISGVVTLGAVIKGDTDHDVVITHSVAKKLLDLSLKYEKPVSLGILGPNITWEQGRKRINEYSERAVDAVVKMLK